MKILHLVFGLPPYASGGLPLYTQSLIDSQLDSGKEIVVLEPGSLFGKNTKIVKKKSDKYSLYRIYPALQVPYNFGISDPSKCQGSGNIKVYEDFLKEIRPDIIHVHSIMGIHKEFFLAAKKENIKMVMTTHDYFGFCLRANFICRDGSVCSGNDPLKCAKCNFNVGISNKKSLIIQTDFYKTIKNASFLKKIRKSERNSIEESKHDPVADVSDSVVKQYSKLLDFYQDIYQLIDYFIYNSDVTKDIYEQYIKKDNVVLPLVLPNLMNQDIMPNKSKHFTIGYIGRNEPYKGVGVLIDAVKKLKNSVCYLYGDDYSVLEDVSNNIYNMGTFNRTDLKKIFSSIDILVMPSIYYETFGLTVLEALAFGVPVLVSSHVGAKNFVLNAPFPVIFEPDSESLYRSLSFMQKKKNLKSYREWIKKQDFCFDMSLHEKLIEKEYNKVLK